MSRPRQTPQRTAIRDAIDRADRPLSPREVLDQAREAVPRIGIATVYRNLKDLVEEGWLVTVDLPGEPPRYERAGKAHHHHFRCRACERVFEVDGCCFIGRDGNLPSGFQLERHEVILHGLCASCR